MRNTSRNYDVIYSSFQVIPLVFKKIPNVSSMKNTRYIIYITKRLTYYSIQVV